MSTANLAPIKNPTPRELFRESGDNVSKHRNMVDLPEFQRANNFGLLEYITMLGGQVRDGNSAMAVGFRLQGALEVLQAMRNLGEKTPMVKQVDNSQLDHRA